VRGSGGQQVTGDGIGVSRADQDGVAAQFDVLDAG
jgi:hypothetical protein